MNKCYICNTELHKANQSEEHIIHNSIGGRLKSFDLLCKKCNSGFGDKSDAELARQLNFFCNMLMIKRERGEPQPIIMENTKTGEKYKINSAGQSQLKDPIVTQENCGDQVKINIKARDINEAKSILNGLKKKYPSMDVDDLLQNAVITEEQILEPLHGRLTVGGKELFPSILKTALNYYINETKNNHAVLKAIESLKNNDTSLVEPIILEKAIYDITESDVCHSIFINGNREEKKLYAIIEYFNIYQFVVKLSDNYTDEDISLLYVYDTILNIEATKEVKYIYPASFIFNFIYANSNPQFSILQSSALRIMKIAFQRQHDERISQIIDSAWKNTIDKLIPYGEPITKEAINMFAAEVAEQFTRYLYSFQKSKQWRCI